MTYAEVIEQFGNQACACRALGIKKQNAAIWKKKGYVPANIQLRIQALTGGLLKASIEQGMPK